MRLRILNAATGEEGELEEDDDVLGPDATVQDVKGLIRLWTGESVQRQTLLLGAIPTPSPHTPDARGWGVVGGEELPPHATLD
eukprot:gene55086-35826_t